MFVFVFQIKLRNYLNEKTWLLQVHIKNISLAESIPIECSGKMWLEIYCRVNLQQILSKNLQQCGVASVTRSSLHKFPVAFKQ